MLQTAAFTDLRNYITKRIYKAQYQRGGSWYDAALVSKEVTSSGIARIKVQISPGVACTITGVRLINTENQVWAVKSVNVVLETAETNLLQWFDFEVTEEES
jgi:hypothetical protein